MNWYTTVLKRYAVFSGRASRSEFWFFTLFSFIVSVILGSLDGVLGTTLLGTIYSLAVLLPNIGVAIRRMHDTGKSGWFILIPFYNLYLAIIDGDKGENKYGPRPIVEAAKAEAK